MSNKLIKLATYPFSRAEIIKEHLMNEGIDCSLSNINAISTIPGGAVRIWVMEKDYPDAAAILIELEEEFAEERIEDIEIVEDIQRILCPVNFSDVSFEAAKFALHIASELDAQLIIVNAYNFPIVQSVNFMDTTAIAYTEDKTFKEIQDEANNNLVDFIKRLKEYADNHQIGETVVKSFLLNGHPADEVLRYVEDNDVHAIVLSNYTSEKEGGLSYVSEQIIEHAGVPVLALPFEAKYVSISDVQVLYITDHSDADYYSIKKLLTLLYPFDVHVHCLSMHQDIKMAELESEKWKIHFSKRYSGFKFSCHIATYANFMEKLNTILEETPIEMLAVLSHRKSFFQELFNPGFEKKYLFDLKIPVLIFHDKN